MAKFTSFEEKTDLLPTEQQVQCMSDLVKSMDLQSGGFPALHPAPGPGLYMHFSGGDWGWQKYREVCSVGKLATSCTFDTLQRRNPNVQSGTLLPCQLCQHPLRARQ